MHTRLISGVYAELHNNIFPIPEEIRQRKYEGCAKKLQELVNNSE